MQAYRASGPMLLIIPFLHINTLSLLFVYLMAWDECMVTWPAHKQAEAGHGIWHLPIAMILSANIVSSVMCAAICIVLKDG